MENKAFFKTDPGGWIHIAPFGEHPHSCGVIQVIDRKACDAMISSFDARRVKEGEAFAGVLLDYDHFSMDTDKPSEAAGWIVELSTRDDGLWGRVRWTDTGLKAVEGGRYRLVSAVFPRMEDMEVVDAKLNKRRPLELRSCALTNEPNIKGGRPIANRQSGSSLVHYCESSLVENRDGGGKEEGGGRKEDGGVGGTLNVQRTTLNAQEGEWDLTQRRKDAETGNRETAGIPGVAVGGEGAKRYMWLLGENESGRHCPVCTERHGQVKTLLEWMKMPAPYCRCSCHLAEVGVDVKEGHKPPKPTGTKKRAKDVKNRAGRVGTLLTLREVRGVRNRWSDAARVASAAARLAKYGAMMGLRPWGDVSRLAAAAARKKNLPSVAPAGAVGYASAGSVPSAGKKRSATKPRAKKMRAVDKSNDVCFFCGGKGHWAYECPVKADKVRLQAKIDAGVEKYKRVLGLPDRPGGYRLDGSPAIFDMTGGLADWAKTFRGDGTPVMMDAGMRESLSAAADKDFKSWLGRVGDAEDKIETFNALVAALGGAVAAAAGAVNPSGAAADALGAEVGAAAGKKPFAKRVEAYRRLEQMPVNPYQMFGKGYDPVKDPPGMDGLTRREKMLVAVKTRDKANSMWFQSFNGTPAEGNTNPPDDPAEMFRQLPKVTGRPDIVKELVDMSKQDVLKSRARLRRTVDEEAAVRKAYIDDILKADPQARYNHDIRHIDTRFLRMWRDRVTGTGIYGQTGAKSSEVMSGELAEKIARGDFKKPGYEFVPKREMKEAILEWLPEVSLEVVEWAPQSIQSKLYQRAMDRKFDAIRKQRDAGVGFGEIDGESLASEF